MEQNKFKILSIDGGGIRGIFPAMFLAQLEANLKESGNPNWQVYQNFDLICGTSTGGIIAIALSLGIPAKVIYELYYDNAKIIFGKKRRVMQLIRSAYKTDNIESLIRKKFAEFNNGIDPRLKDCKKPTCVTVYDLQEGCPRILKSKYHPKFINDYHIPAYQAALATSAAPTYFNPYSSSYTDLNGLAIPFHNKVDGGVFCNNPTLTAILEAQKAFSKELKDLSILSIGTGHQKFCDTGIINNTGFPNKILKMLSIKNKNDQRNNWGILYWINIKRKKLIELFLQGQTQQVENMISLMQHGIGKQEDEHFSYDRIDTELDETCKIELDETNKSKLEKLAEKATREFQKSGSLIIRRYCS
ncbi:CBASS cGAMP-activated phospholipase [Parasediminibacterium sp. JCM 36343]|uniref:CBASS cGAMP-activated phospholipase n=1 Tax=Parasediminibacterium sp. JCM 36343 TaxID=3374279 RepID=UPI00397D2696